MIDTLRLTVDEAQGLLERGEVTPAELHRAYLDAAAERDGELHTYLRTVEDGADGSTGVPIAFKDLVSTKGVETTAGSKILAGYKPVFDATVATRCKDAGSIVIPRPGPSSAGAQPPQPNVMSVVANASRTRWLS